MGSLESEILRELQLQRQMMEGIIGAGSAATAQALPVKEPQPEGLMTDYDCLLICMSDDVVSAIDRWNKSRPSCHSSAKRH